MKKFFNKIGRQLTALYEKIIFSLYKRLRRKRSFVHSIHHHDVKKGKRRYTLMIVETSFGKLIWNLGRHREDTFIHFTKLEPSTRRKLPGPRRVSLQ